MTTHPFVARHNHRLRPTCWVAFVGLVLSLCSLPGCDALRSAAEPEANRPPSADGTPPLPATGPTRHKTGKATLPPDDVATSPPAKNGLIRSLKDQVESNQAIEESGVIDPLLDSLMEADEILSQTKLRNREAIRQTNRQVRVGSARQSPNLILVLVDRLGQSELGCYGHLGAATPHLDKLAANGMRFENYYAGGPNPEAGFWSLMTGRNASRAPRTESPFQLRETDVTLADVLWKASYTTAYYGQWTGTNRPLEHGFDDWAGRVPTNDAAEAFPEVLLTGKTQMRVLKNRDGQRQTNMLELLQAEVQSYLERSATASRPFLMVVRLPSAAVCQRALGNESTPLAAWDQFVGAITHQLSEQSQQRRTCVLFTALSGQESDDASGHGKFRTAEHGLGEAGLRVPLIVSWAGGVPRDTVADHVCAAWDILPTCTELAHVSPRPIDLDGLSFNSALHQQTQAPHTLLFWESRGTPHVQAVRKGEWKGVYVAGDQTLRLYNLQQDPGETTDVAGEHPDVVKQLIVPRKPVTKPRA
jgi:arylsulfatase A